MFGGTTCSKVRLQRDGEGSLTSVACAHLTRPRGDVRYTCIFGRWFYSQNTTQW